MICLETCIESCLIPFRRILQCPSGQPEKRDGLPEAICPLRIGEKSLRESSSIAAWESDHSLVTYLCWSFTAFVLLQRPPVDDDSTRNEVEEGQMGVSWSPNRSTALQSLCSTDNVVKGTGGDRSHYAVGAPGSHRAEAKIGLPANLLESCGEQAEPAS